MEKQYAFTSRAGSLANVLVSAVIVHIPPLNLDGTYDTQPLAMQYNAIWDTGATGSVVTKRVAEQLDLKPISVQEVRHAGGVSSTNVYLVSLVLPNGVNIKNVRVTEAPRLSDECDVLIGMDIITLGDFAVTNKDKRTTFSFRVPAQQEIDFVPHAAQVNKVIATNVRGSSLASRKKKKSRR